ncbi:LLM class flavin-dependent oxidoreductase [Acidipropionibacterium jensenii]|uniref:Limonene 1,2-monooxygenase n=2 Tax=Acidipropionibacterium jensenii TaxID=1749 RepID=A0A448P0X1_9ACTN|nr:LLM class flavin-dependent oxidoreductase [Acidipropionibacterium jensenii]MDN5978091.1 LLM class flavin-dependent oxidoreductase [Acidipropionibacterium jensenii]MDN5996879.1 LLM class flavin-dependent oxidoreductase [Acidipropionibacterium jensenii]MDN6427261.1 LLM class flavin-dependent oxidoreductase [Acidipropionibacterium jensenii]MDN6442121.1 LLM class flavin-dependent oxidoreductase [Acidipropionibacterium jensenii]MDN6480848.1 LLM class flavin-dependent oxidoreductase [Acidipropion
MKSFGFLSFGHYGRGTGPYDPDAARALREAIEIAQGADELGVNGAYFRVHHFARQAASPMPLLSAIAATTKRIEVGTGVIDMRYENPLYLAEEAGALDLIADNRIALGISRGSPEPALRGYQAFGYTGSSDPRGADLARDKFDLFLRAIGGERVAEADPEQFGPGQRLRIEPHSPGLTDRIWWGSGTAATAEWVGRLGVNLMSSTLLTEANGGSFAEIQAAQIRAYRQAWKEAGHTRTPRVSVSRSIFPVLSKEDLWFAAPMGDQSRDQIGMIDGFVSTFGKTYSGDPDTLIAELKADVAIQEADTLMLTIPSQLGPEVNLRLLENFATHIAPALGWQPNTEGPTTGYPID